MILTDSERREMHMNRNSGVDEEEIDLRLRKARSEIQANPNLMSEARKKSRRAYQNWAEKERYYD